MSAGCALSPAPGWHAGSVNVRSGLHSMVSRARLSRGRQRRAAPIVSIGALAVVASAWRPCAAQAGAGHVDERVTSASDTAQHFALYLPPGYTRERRWPVLLVLDPRGRALLGLQLFHDAAARLGWIVMSSYNTLSDGPPEPSVLRSEEHTSELQSPC